ncbi:TRAP transporter substrate-binding protein DctP [Inmirania thermothiophila]|uniref:TRAP-type C4-dicarboxylate transport system substrate-binding protein n=1 Tax=Inmirania thermothiophila TaxID=1750597 RepID=A0A3N1Y0T2_9GAMM|nr:TRAP transporter substrate-binding protein DctP [Inmirania thermothiophila]ROR32445.1 TRAP-type C4-dicarboxylate transport system substrate-binding protein [Inmirania thermothiophila]
MGTRRWREEGWRRLRALAAGMLLGLAATPAAALELKLATLAPEGSSWMARLRQADAEIREATGGRVGLRLFGGGVMGDDVSVLRKMRIGQLHGGIFTAGSLAALSPELELYSLPFLFRSHAEVARVRARFDGELLGGLAAHGLEGIGIAGGGFAYVMSREPVRAVADLEGRKVWMPAGDPLAGAVMKAVLAATSGITVVPLPLGDVYAALQTGLVDTVATSAIGAIVLRWNAAVRYLTDVPLLYVYAVLVVDRKALARIAAADRGRVVEALRRAFADIDRGNVEEEARAREALRAQGVSFVTPEPEELRRWRELGRTARALLIRTGGVDPARVAHLEQALAELRGEGR